MSFESRYIRIKKRPKHKDVPNSFDETFDDKPINIDASDTIGPKILQSLLSSRRTLFLSLMTFRAFNSLMNQTQSVPDEYWQSVEVAHKWAFNIGYLTWEWHPETAIRSPVYPLIFAIPFKIMQLLHLDGRIWIIKLPGLLHAVMASISDYYLYLLSFRQAGQKVAQWTLFNQLINWFTFYSSTRTLSNTIEWFIITLALYEYQRIVDNDKRILSRRFLFLVCLCFILRPTGLVVLLPICVYHVLSLVGDKGTIVALLLKTVANGLLVSVFSLSLSLVIDKHFYGRWTCSQWNFLHFNLLTDVSHNYGVHSWHWYVSNAIPVIFWTQLPLLIFSFWSEWKEKFSRHLIGLSILVLYLYSCLGHKEFRFIFPLMPIGMLFLGRMFDRYRSKRRLLVMFLLVSQVPMCMYMSVIHQRGGLDVVMAVGRHVERHPSHIHNTSAVFLMPCHSTPWSSHLHYNISSRFLTCDPQITGTVSLFDTDSQPLSALKSYDEADLFYEDPVKWLKQEYSSVTSRPTMWVMFDQLRPDLLPLMTQWNYHLCNQFFHAHFPTHSRHSTVIVVFCTHGFQL